MTTGPGSRPPLPWPTTRLCVLLGDPVAHSGSCAMHNAAFTTEGIDAVYLACRVTTADFGAAVRGLSALGAVGANVTVPHKQRALGAADAASDAARLAGMANVLTFKSGRVYADNTDGEGFLRAAREAGVRLRDADVLILGAGGAARAAASAAALAGAARVTVLNRTPGRAERLVADLRARGEHKFTTRLEAGSLERVRQLAGGADWVVNATSLGLDRSDPSPVRAWPQSRPGQWALDLVYAPHATAFVATAEAAGWPALDGRRMLVWQAALSWGPWFGGEGPVEVMDHALSDWLARTGARPPAR